MNDLDRLVLFLLECFLSCFLLEIDDDEEDSDEELDVSSKLFFFALPFALPYFNKPSKLYPSKPMLSIILFDILIGNC